MKLNLKNLLQDKQISQPYSFLEKNGFAPHVALRLLSPKCDRLQLKEMLQLCSILYCTPNDLFVIDEAAQKLLPEGHPLLQIKPREGKTNLIEKLRQVPLDKLDEVYELIEQKEAKRKL